ncbi:MAG TPA: alpha/beta fold hydrolase, partial [Acidimicrobiales bacterium]|nr:alpha/beta fold hydrolase [Acidimicrobiales bacterium]
AAQRTAARWQSAEDGLRPGDLDLPDGKPLTVTTDDGAELAGTVAGEGPLVVFSHCWTGSRIMWAPVAHRLLEADHRVVLYDQRGHGESTAGDEGFTIERLGADLKAVLEAVDARDAVLAGHSMGGMTIQALAAEHPDVVAERARGIVLVATAASGIGRGAGVDALGVRLIASPVIERALRSRAGHALVRGSVGRSVRHGHLVVTRDLFVACAPEARSELLGAMFAMDLREGIAGIGVPTTVVVGSRDQLTRPKLAAELADAIPEARLVTIPDAGHQLPLEAPDELTEEILTLTRRSGA